MALTWLTLDADTFYSLGIIMILVGIVVLIVAFILLLISSVKGGVRGGGALIIGPLPIVFGTDKESVKAVLWLSIILAIIVFTLFMVLHLLGR